MELPIEIVSADAVRGLIARGVLGDEGQADSTSTRERSNRLARLGSVTLHPHQLSAIERLRAAIDEFGGALLADEVGMGKTFVALAIARQFQQPIVVGPAVLREMWLQQAKAAGSVIRFASFESLSRGRVPDGPFDLIVMDEAHHIRNPSTRRYRMAARMALRSPVLMISATPVHNRRADLTALLSIFLGSRAATLSSSEIGRCVVRRRIESVRAAHIPDTGELIWKELCDDDRVPAALLSLPPPVAPRGGGDGGVLVVRSLLRQWSSSDAALESALRRRMARSIALISALESGHYPSESELSAWTFVDDSLQLAFPSFVATPLGDAHELLITVRAHSDALRKVLRMLDPNRPRDFERAKLLKTIREVHTGIPIVAFSQYAETVRGLFCMLRSEKGVAVLTAGGARVAGGAIPRRDAISRFAPRASGVLPARYADRIDLLLCTDLLSEGVNLQDAGVVVHLDLPWTSARLEQRMGRVARLGSSHARVYAYGIRPPAAAEFLVRLEATIRSKMVETERSIGVFRTVLPERQAESGSESSTAALPSQSDPATATERIRSHLHRWARAAGMGLQLAIEHKAIRVAAVESDMDGFLALSECGTRISLVASDGLSMTEQPAEILEIILDASGPAVRPTSPAVDRALALSLAHYRARQTVALAEDETALVARARKGALRRIAATVQAARPHERARLIELGNNARHVVLGRLGAAAEAELARLAAAETPDEEWLRLIAGGQPSSKSLGSSSALRHSGPIQPRLIAILLLQRRENTEGFNELVNAVTVARER